MADRTNSTILEKITQYLQFEESGMPSGEDQQNKKIVIRGNKPEDILRKSRELQQAQKNQKKFFDTTDKAYQKSMQFEAQRLPAYLDYEGMEYYPIIGRALDLIAEEATTIGETGKMLNIYSDKDRIKDQLESLFYDKLNVNVTLPLWTRNTIKYGDNFVYLLGEKTKGIVHAKQLTNYDVERKETITNGKLTVKFTERDGKNEFNIFEIAHFRVLGDDKYLPYGSSILNKLRRVFRQLIMAEDAMLTYRILRAGEKRVFKIDVGNMDDDDIEPYIAQVANNFKRTANVFPENGNIDYKFNILGNDEDIFLPVRNGNTQTGIDTLQGASNLDQIQDIEYLRDNLYTGLGVPKQFLSFQGSAGEGKNMAQMDIRFTKMVNRVQVAMVQELKKIAIIHLFLCGFKKEDMKDFDISLNNPSRQNEILENEILSTKGQIYNDLTRSENGIAGMSHTLAKKKIFRMSDQEIVNDLKVQYMERALAQQLQDAPFIVKDTGLFSVIEDKYGTGEAPSDEDREQGEGDFESNPSPTGAGGDGDFDTPNDLPPVQGEGKKRQVKISIDSYLNEIISVSKTGQNKQLEAERISLMEAEKKNTSVEKMNIDNSVVNKMVEEIDNLIDEDDKIKSNFKEVPMKKWVDDIENVNIDELNLDSPEIDN